MSDSGPYGPLLEKIKELESKLKRCEENLVAIADIFIYEPTLRVEARNCLNYINPEKYKL